MRKKIPLIKELGLLIGALAVLLLAALGLYHLVGSSPRRPPSMASADPSPIPDSRPEKRDSKPAIPLERSLKALIKESILKEETVIDDPSIRQGMDAIVERLLSAEPVLSFQPEVLVIDSPVVNALAFPGGLIVVYAGLIERLESAEEMAAVLAHELGHVAHRDSMNRLLRYIGISTLTSLIGGRQAEVLVRRIIREVVDMKYSRSVEWRADGYALELLARARLDPGRLAQALDHLREEGEGEEDRPANLLRYLDSHPDLERRIHRAREFSASRSIQEQKLEIDWEEAQSALPSLF